MKRIKNVLFVVLAVSCLAASLFGVLPTSSQSTDNYSPWADLNDDGIIDIFDIVPVALAFGSSGTPLTKATIEYDSGWIDITGRQGQYITVTHGLNITDWNDENIDMSIMGKTSPDGELLRNLGLTGPAQGWNKTYGRTNVEYATALVQSFDGGYAVTGYTTSLGAGASDVWLIKTDASGNEQWNKTYGGAIDDSAYYIIQTADGGYALTGVTTSFGAGSYDAWFIKTDANGNMEWNKTYGGPNYDWADAVVQTTDGGYALACWTNKGWGSGYYDFWLIKTDANGNAQWNQTYGGPDYDVPWRVVQTGDGGYALFGTSYAWGSYNFWLLKTDANGNQQWNQTYGGTNDDYGYGFVQTNDDGYALGGRTNSFGAGSFDFWLVKTDAYGNMQWNKTYGGTGDEGNGLSLAQTGDGGYALGAPTNSFGAGNYDFWLVKTDSGGNQLWNRTYGGTGEDMRYAHAMIQTSDGGYAMTGHTNSFGAGLDDVWIVKTDAAGNALDGFKWYGLARVGSTPNTIKLYRGTDDEYWNYVRVRVWKPKTP